MSPFKYFFCNPNAKYFFYNELESLHMRHVIFQHTQVPLLRIPFNDISYRWCTILSVEKVQNIVDLSSYKITRILTTVEHLL